jgi:hypothetical protein
MKNLKTINEALRFAAELAKQAQKNETSITAELENIARKVSAELIGLENKLKSENSLTRKLVGQAAANSKSVQKIAENINDVLRYTFVLPFEIYAEGVGQTIEMLQNSGYGVPPKRIWNAWQTIGMRFDKGYRGINMTVISSQNQKFELQFHTAASFRLKDETHFLYEELRETEISKQRETELIEQLKKAANGLKRPEGV